MRPTHLLSLCLTAAAILPVRAIETDSIAQRKDSPTKKFIRTTVSNEDGTHRLQFGSYGEAAYSRNFYSDNVYRYQNPTKYRNDPSHGRMDLPHVNFSLSYNFGKGWKFSTEIEFEHGGTGSAYEQEYEEGGEWEQELERGGEVVLEQMWLEKSFSKAFNVRVGHIIVPVGLTNAHHEPLNFFTVYRPEGESTIMPCTWHQTGISLWGRAGDWRYELQGLAGLDALNFTRDNWIQGGAASAFEFSTATKLAVAARIDNYSIPGLRIGLSGYYTHSMHNSFPHDLEGEDENGNKKKYSDVKGAVAIAALDFTYKAHNWRINGSADYGHLGDAATISQIKKNLTSSNAPTNKTYVGEKAYAFGLEAGYDVFSQIRKTRERGQQLYLFGRYDCYDAYVPAEGMQDYRQTFRRTMTFGLNYMPIKEIAVKAQFAKTFLKSPLNDEPSVSLGIVYQGFFLR